MITKVQVYTSVPSVSELLLDESGTPETDYIQVLNVIGLDPINSNLNMAPYGSIDGAEYVGGEISSRNIVLTLRPNPNWTDWTFETLRQFIYSYFVSKSTIKLIFDSDEVGTVHISGIVEGVSANPFTKDPEYLVSIICPDPYFYAVEPQEYSGTSIRPGGTLTAIENEGNIVTGIYLKVEDSTDDASYVGVQIGDPPTTYFHVAKAPEASKYFEMNSRPREKFVRLVNLTLATFESCLSKISLTSRWPYIPPGDSMFGVITDAGSQDWTLRFFKRFGGL